MAKPAERKQIGGEAIQIGDCQVWVEICYLDSKTDYREYLPRKRVRFRSDDHVLSGSSTPSPRLNLRSVFAWAATPLLLLAISWLSMYLIWESW